MDETYLAHHGIKGQRWGVRRTPEQLGHPVANPRPKPKTNVKDLVKKAQKTVKNIQKQKEQKKQDELKEYLRKHPKELTKYADKLTEKDADEIIAKINFDRKLADISEQESARGWKKIENLQSRLSTTANLIGSSTKLYNSTADIWNSLIENGIIKDGSKWPKFGSEARQDRSAFDKLIRTGTAEAILDKWNELTVNEQRDWISRQRQREVVEGYTEKRKKEEASKAESKPEPEAKKKESILRGEFSDLFVDTLITDPAKAKEISPFEWEEFRKRYS